MRWEIEREPDRGKGVYRVRGEFGGYITRDASRRQVMDLFRIEAGIRALREMDRLDREAEAESEAERGQH